MPFKSEAQRRYLWANEPEIARDWTDTYGSRIQAALGGIMASRVGLKYGLSPHEAQARGLGHQHHGSVQAKEGDWHAGNVPGGKEGAGLHPDFGWVAPPPPGDWGSTPSPKGFLERGIDFYKKYGTLPNLYKGLKNIFTDRRPPPGSPDYNRTATFAPPPPRGGEGISYIPSYLANLYPRNIVDEDVLDIDTSTGNMEDWSQRFRVDNPYRQDQGALDDQIREYISTLYT